ncbi:uncharacterized protein EDB93DRAFT_127041 [Suillus bovinus]|uniref:uncharacterized protein n=1 Tax=Suillus bovinus TaxID=48563 RepID=UPI001B884E99|nr:uncharacterized protein EDB93DRAFT_127041 [Suillus bovinus]KAG2154975.1 hypothetical protein EDB93DRAFT_127041 [Suillus bovinus]
MTNEPRAHSPLSRVRGVHEEWMQITDSLRRIGNEYNQIVIDSVDKSRAHEIRATEWEARHHDVITENNTFRAHNEELKRLLELSKPDVSSAIEGRDAAYRKLRHVRRVMRDLFVDLPPDFGDSPNEAASLLLQAEPQPQYKDISASSSPGQSRRNDTSSNSSGSGDTARPISKGKERSAPRTSMTVPISSPTSTSCSRASRTRGSGVVSNLSNQQRSSESNSSSEPSVDLSVHAAKRSSGGVDDVWKLSSSRSPRCAEVICPVDMQFFQDQLNLGEDTIYSLESLGQADEHCFPLQIVDNMAFVHDPFSMDGPGESFLMNWGTPDANETVHAYIVKNRPRDRVLHTFTFPVKRGVWYYIGAHKWNVKDLFEVWPTLGDKAKEVVTGKLQKRCNRRLSPQEIVEMIQDGRLQQFCVQVSSGSLKDLSRAFAKTSLGYEGRSVTQ